MMVEERLDKLESGLHYISEFVKSNRNALIELLDIRRIKINKLEEENKSLMDVLEGVLKKIPQEERY